MTLWPFSNEKWQKVISLLFLIAGVILVFNIENITAGAILSLIGLVYLLDAI